jgi:hypothetical protein
MGVAFARPVMNVFHAVFMVVTVPATMLPWLTVPSAGEGR